VGKDASGGAGFDGREKGSRKGRQACEAILPVRTEWLLRRIGQRRRDGEARVLRGLWLLLGTDTIVEFKSPARPPRKGDLLRLMAYGALYHATQTQLDRLEDPRDLTLVLVVASVSSALREEIRRMGWTVTPLGDGYGRIDGGVYATYLVITDEVAPAERDDFLAIFSHHRATDPEAIRWFSQWLAEGKKMHNIEQLDDYKDVVQKLLQSLPPEERVAGLAPEQILLTLPVEALRALSDEYLQSLKPEVAEQIRKRIGR
jgi:hypothetical protein